ncbi:adhesin transport system membrane fusion protein [Polymorphobacter multimanifer]|uniref:Membrane fusion protein (MFP) family protein n=2 Tax=Polymorphobacter multimanifer TaxID=1070431 RepID=A0A841L5T7_9SPHN|nr:HlyD family type I secretion periplasmic adaptor subunit [Polymorphobacter multimanifer]MBB6227616.1 adhesin transport system membrane fusion protein [Polymorphobacter multimanifer]
MTLPAPLTAFGPPVLPPALPLGLDRLPDDLTPSAAARISFRLIVGSLAALLAWAALSRIEASATAPGTVVPAGKLQTVSHPEGGTLKAILVKPGQRVRAGAVLLRLDPGLAGGELGRNASARNALDARIARLRAEATGQAPVFPAALTVAAPALVAAEQAVHAARMASFASAGGGEAASVDAARRTLAEAEADAAARTEARAQAAREVTLMASLVEKGLEPRISLDRARSALAQAQAGADAAAAAIARARAGVTRAGAGLAGVSQNQRAEAGQALAAALAERAGLAAGLPSLAGRVDRTTIRAAADSVVNRVLVNTPGSAVTPGQALVELLPAGERLVIDARLKPADIAFAHAGQRATVRLTAYDSAVFGSLDGTVEAISPDAITDPRTGESHYDVRIRLKGAALEDAGGAPLPIAPGMVAEVSLLGQPRSVLSWLLTPFTRLRQQAFRER